MTAVLEDLQEIADTNMHDGDKVKGAAAIDAFPGLGKTTTALTFARQFHRREAGQHGVLTPDGHEYLPVCRVSLAAGTTIKALNRAILGFYAHPATGRYDRSTTGQLASQALDCILSCRTSLVVIDVHFLDMRRRDGIEVSNHLKWLASEFPVTFLFAGVSLRERGLMSEGMSAGGQASAQTARRWTRLTLDPFTISDDPGRRQWRSLLLAIEKHLILARRAPRHARRRPGRLPVRAHDRSHRLADDAGEPQHPEGNPPWRGNAHRRTPGHRQDRRGGRAGTHAASGRARRRR